MAGWTRKKQALHDKVAGCLVVHARSPALQPGGMTVRRHSLNTESQNTESQADFEAEALRRFKAGQISEEAFLDIVKSKK